MNSEILCNNIKKKCSEKGISVAQLEKELNFSTGSIGKWRQSFPSIEKVYSVSEYFGISLDELCSEDRKMSDTGFMDMLLEKVKEKEIVWLPCSGKEISSLRFSPFCEAGYYEELYMGEYEGVVFYIGSSNLWDEEIDFYISLDRQICFKQDEEEKLLKNLWEFIKQEEQETYNRIIKFKKKFVEG